MLRCSHVVVAALLQGYPALAQQVVQEVIRVHVVNLDADGLALSVRLHRLQPAVSDDDEPIFQCQGRLVIVKKNHTVYRTFIEIRAQLAFYPAVVLPLHQLLDGDGNVIEIDLNLIKLPW